MEELLPKVDNWFDFLSVHQEMLSDEIRIENSNDGLINKNELKQIVFNDGALNFTIKSFIDKFIEESL